MGILIPWAAKHFDKVVLSQTPGNFLAEKTVKTSEKHEARTGARSLLTPMPEEGRAGWATLTKEKRRLLVSCQQLVQVTLFNERLRAWLLLTGSCPRSGR